jgi:hypothetical protein
VGAQEDERLITVVCDDACQIPRPPHEPITRTSQMLRNIDIFTTYGSLTATIIEGVDLADKFRKGRRGKVLVYAAVRVTDEDGVELGMHNTATQVCLPALAMPIGEQFVYENVSSAHCMHVTFFAMCVDRTQPMEGSLVTCLGETEIPLERLGNNKPVSETLCVLWMYIGGLEPALLACCRLCADPCLRSLPVPP